MKNQRGFAHLFLVVLLLIGLGVGVYLVGQKTNLKPKASSSENLTLLSKTKNIKSPEKNPILIKITPPWSLSNPKKVVLIEEEDIFDILSVYAQNNAGTGDSYVDSGDSGFEQETNGDPVDNPGGGIGSEPGVDPGIPGDTSVTESASGVETWDDGVTQTTTENPDGSITTETSFPDGTTQTSTTQTNETVSSITEYNDGSISQTNPDGSITTTTADGSVTTSYNDGTSVSTNTLDDGTTQTTVGYPDGTTQTTTTSPDGLSTTTSNETGSQTTTTDPSTGVVTTDTSYADGSTSHSVTQPDGSNSTTVNSPDGTSFTNTTDASGATTTSFSDGSQSISDSKEDGVDFVGSSDVDSNNNGVSDPLEDTDSNVDGIADGYEDNDWDNDGINNQDEPNIEINEDNNNPEAIIVTGNLYQYDFTKGAKGVKIPIKIRGLKVFYGDPDKDGKLNFATVNDDGSYAFKVAKGQIYSVRPPKGLIGYYNFADAINSKKDLGVSYEMQVAGLDCFISDTGADICTNAAVKTNDQAIDSNLNFVYIPKKSNSKHKKTKIISTTRLVLAEDPNFKTNVRSYKLALRKKPQTIRYSTSNRDGSKVIYGKFIAPGKDLTKAVPFPIQFEYSSKAPKPNETSKPKASKQPKATKTPKTTKAPK